MSDSPLPPPPQPFRGKSVVVAALKGGVGAIPTAGAALAELIGLAFGERHQARMQAWLGEVAVAINELQSKGNARPWDELLDDDAFFDVLLTATRAAEKTSREAQVKALRHAVMSSAGSSAPADDLERRFIDIVDQSTPDHLDLLLHLHAPDRSLAIAGTQWEDAIRSIKMRLPFGSTSEPPVEVYLAYMRQELRTELLKISTLREDVASRLMHDLNSWQLLENNLELPLNHSFLSPLGEQLLVYVGITGATSAAFEAFDDANH